MKFLQWIKPKSLARILYFSASTLVCSAMAASTATTTLVVSPRVTLVPNGGIAESAIAADMNGDGLTDIVVGTNFSTPYVYLNNGTDMPFSSVQGKQVSTSDPQQSVAVADMNGDGHPDIMAGGFGTPTKIYLNNGSKDPFNGVSGSDLGTGVSDDTTNLAIGDVNGDGFPDVVTANTNQEISKLYLNNGTSNPFSGVTPLDIGSDMAYGESVAIADVNGDGKPDVVIGDEILIGSNTSAVRIYLNNGTSNPFGGVTPIRLLQNKVGLAVAIADLNGDGRKDLVIASDQISGNFVFLNTGSGTQPFSSPASFVQDPHFDEACLGIAIADMNGDGLPDLAFGCGANTSSSPLGAVYLNNGAAEPFAGVKPTEIPNGVGGDFSRSAVVSDLTNNGSVDLLLGISTPSYFPLILDANPVANNDTASTVMNQFVDVDVLANDTDADGTLNKASLKLTTKPLHGTTRINPNNDTVIYQPDSGFTGTDSLQYTVADNLGAVSNTATLAVTVANTSSSGGGGDFEWISILLLTGLALRRRTAER